jgi:DNA-directed RNA polymerase II subunit RPB2
MKRNGSSNQDGCYKRKKESLMNERSCISSEFIRELNVGGHHTSSYNDAISRWIRDIIFSNGTITQENNGIRYTFTLSNYVFTKSDEFPSVCHNHNTSYNGSIFSDITEIRTKKDPGGIYVEFNRKTYPRHKICEFPVMLFSSACHFSDGCDQSIDHPEYAGGFIVKGKRRYIPLLKTTMKNTPIRSFNRVKQMYCVQVRSEHIDKPHRSTSTLELVINAKNKKKNDEWTMLVSIPFVKQLVPIGILLISLQYDIQLFCVNVKKNMGKYWNERFTPYLDNVRSYSAVYNTESAQLRMAQVYGRGDDTISTMYVLKNEILPHLKTDEQREYYLSYMYMQCVLLKSEILDVTDRDHRQYTRIVDTGTSLAFLFRILFVGHVKQANKVLRRMLGKDKEIDVNKIYNDKRLTSKLVTAIATGNWSQKRKGVSHQLVTTNDQAIISQLRRITSSFLNNDGKHLDPRMLHPSSCGFECAAETPEGESCGLVTALASTASVSREIDVGITMEVFMKCASHLICEVDEIGTCHYKVIDGGGCIIGGCENISELNNIFLNLRRSLMIPVGVTREQDDVSMEWYIHTSIGRMIRPLLVMNKIGTACSVVRNHQAGTSLFRTLLSRGCIEYVCPAEEKMLSPTFNLEKSSHDSSHLEINDVSFVGLVAAMSPFFRHNQGPRLAYWIGMSKQVISLNSSVDIGSATSHSLLYGQVPLVKTQTAVDMNFDQIPSCVNVNIIFFPCSENQEDAIIMNRHSIDRGMFVSQSIRTYVSETFNTHDQRNGDIFENPKRSTTVGTKNGDYSKISTNGLPLVGAVVKGGDVLIGRSGPYQKVSVNAEANVPSYFKTQAYQKKRRDKSVQVREDERGVVYDVTSSRKSTGRIVKARVYTVRVPEVGDKFSSRHAQKGTIGRIANPSDLPFSAKTGMIPDIVMSPLGITSRMTMGKVIELVLGKSAAISGNFMDGIDEQDFNTSMDGRLKTIQKVLRNAGFNVSGKEVFINGITGEQISVPVMSGVVSYVKLNHMVGRKAHARSTGPVDNITRQPTEGRRQGGGLRFGQMESECVMAHAASEVMRERMIRAADPFTCFVCAHCGYIAEGNKTIGYFYCRMCRTGKFIKEIEIGYSCKLLTQELNATGIKVRMSIADESKGNERS